MKKTIVSLICTLALCLGLLPTAALAAAPSGQELYVGGVQISSTGYWTTDSDGNVAAYTGQGTPTDNYIYYDADTNTLTLHNATIKKELDYDENTPAGLNIHGSAIGVLNQSGDAELTVQLEGSNTIDEVSTGIYVYSTGDGAALSITGNSTLAINSTSSTIRVVGSGGNASLSIESAKVTATNSAGYGVIVQSDGNSSASLNMDGGSLAATTQSSGSSGIRLRFGTGGTVDSTPTVTVSNNASVRANGGEGGITSNSSTGVQYGTGGNSSGGIVFDGTKGTVYGDVTLQNDLTVGADETLTIGKDATLTVPADTTLTNDGTVTNNGTLTNSGTVNNTGTMTGGITGNVPPQITATTLPNGEVDKAYSQTLAATGNNITWSLASGSALPEGLTLNSNGTISGTPTKQETAKFTVTATNNYGSDTKQFTIQINYQTTAITTHPQNAAVIVGQSATFTVAATGNNLTYQWQYSVDEGKNWTAIGGANSNSYTTAATTLDMNGYQYRCVVKGADNNTVESNAATLTVNPLSVTGVKLDKTTLALFVGNSGTLKATVEPADATNPAVTWSTSNAAIATVDQTGKVTAVAPGTATITVTTQDGAKTATCAVTVTAKTYSMSIDPGAIGFGNVQVGYTQPAVKEVVVKNTGNQPLTLTQPTANNYQVGSLNQFTVAPGDAAIFTVQPKAGLLTGSYNETVTVSAAGAQSVSVNLTFTVGSPVTSGTATTEKRTLHFDTNGGLAMADVVRGLGAPVELWPYTPVRAGYLFQGWYSDQALTKAVSSVVLTKDTTIYAKWAVDPAAAAAQSNSSGSGSSGKGSGSGSSGKGSGSTTITVTPSPTVTPTPAPTATPTPEPTATPEASAEPETDANAASFPVVPVAAGVIVLVVLVGGIVIFRRFRD